MTTRRFLSSCCVEEEEPCCCSRTRERRRAARAALPAATCSGLSVVVCAGITVWHRARVQGAPTPQPRWLFGARHASWLLCCCRLPSSAASLDAAGAGLRVTHAPPTRAVRRMQTASSRPQPAAAAAAPPTACSSQACRADELREANGAERRACALPRLLPGAAPARRTNLPVGVPSANARARPLAPR